GVGGRKESADAETVIPRRPDLAWLRNHERESAAAAGGPDRFARSVAERSGSSLPRISPALRRIGSEIKKGRGSESAALRVSSPDQCARTARSSSAMMLVILIAGFTAGPAVSL